MIYSFFERPSSWARQLGFSNNVHIKISAYDSVNTACSPYWPNTIGLKTSVFGVNSVYVCSCNNRILYSAVSEDVIPFLDMCRTVIGKTVKIIKYGAHQSWAKR